MAVIENLDIVLGARTQGLDQGLDRSTGRVKKFEKDVDKIGEAAKATLAPLMQLGQGLINAIPGGAAAAAAFTAIAAAFSGGAAAKVAKETRETATASAAAAASMGAMTTASAAAAVVTTKVASETQQTARAARRASNEMADFTRAAITAAIAVRSIRPPQLRLPGARGGGLARYNPATAAAGALRGTGDAIDAEFTVLSSSVPRAAGTAGRALTALGPVGIAAGASVAAAFVAVGVAAAATVITIRGVRQQLGEIDEIAKSAAKSNVTFKELAGFRLAVGESTGLGPEAADKSLQKLQIRLAEAKRNGGALNDQLKALGLDSGQLLQAGPIEAMKQLSTATQQMKSPADQLVLAYRLFEEEGAALVSTLRGGPAAMDDTMAAAERMGLALSQAQAKQVEAANDAWGRVELIATGVFRQIAAEVSPLITAISQNISAVADGFGGWEAALPMIVDGLALGAGYMYDWVELVTETLNAFIKLQNFDFSGAAESMSNALSFNTGVDLVAQTQQARLDAAKAAEGSGSGMLDIGAIEAEAEAVRAAAETAKQRSEAEQRARQQNRDAVNERVGGLRDEVVAMQLAARTGQDMATIMERIKLARQGANGNQLNAFDNLTREKKRMEELQEAMDRGIALREQFASPQQQLNKELRELQQLLSVGAIDFGTFARAAREAAGRLGKQDKPERAQPSPTFGALQRGSVEAYSAGLRNENAAKGVNLQAEGNKLLEGVNAELVQMNRYLVQQQSMGRI